MPSSKRLQKHSNNHKATYYHEIPSPSPKIPNTFALPSPCRRWFFANLTLLASGHLPYIHLQRRWPWLSVFQPRRPYAQRSSPCEGRPASCVRAHPHTACTMPFPSGWQQHLLYLTMPSFDQDGSQCTCGSVTLNGERRSMIVLKFSMFVNVLKLQTLYIFELHFDTFKLRVYNGRLLN
jgi:hypothetical protein